MKVTLKGSNQPGSVQEVKMSSSNTSSRDKAIAMLAGAAPAEGTIDQNNIAPENMSLATPDTNALNADMQTSVSSEKQETVQAETAQVAETPKENKQPEQKSDEVSKHYEKLIKQEKALRAKEIAIKQREAELKAKEDSLNLTPKIDQSSYIDKNRLKTDPLSVLAEAGLSYEELTNQLLNSSPKDPRVEATINELKAEIEQLRKANEKSSKYQEEQQQQAYQAAVKQIEVDVQTLVERDTNFETIKATGTANEVVKLITETYHKDGILLSIEEAAQQVEDYLTEEYSKIASINKIKSRLEKSLATKPQPSTDAKPQSEIQQQPKQTQPTMKTLTNNTSASRQLTARERALLAFKGELK
jgi:hypothetical protein